MQLHINNIYLGANTHTPYPLVNITLELDKLASYSIENLGKTFSSQLTQSLQNIKKPNKKDNLTTVFQNIVNTLQQQTGLEKPKSLINPTSSPTSKQILFNYESENITIEACQLAITLICSLLPEELRPNNIVPPNFNFQEAKKQFLINAKNYNLDQTTKALIKAAEKKDIPWFRPMKNSCLIQLGHGHNQQFIKESITDQTSLNAAAISKSKNKTNTFLRNKGIPVPGQHLVTNEQQAYIAAKQLGFPLVVKPNNTDKGQGITLDINNLTGLQAALKNASKFSPQLIIEKHINGEDHRLLIVNGKLIAAAKRIPAHIIGDGKHTIEQLVEKINTSPNRGENFSKLLEKIKFDPQVDQLLQEQGLTRQSIPPKKSVIPLRKTANISTGGTAEDCTKYVHPDNRYIAELAAKAIKLDIAGIDFITTDISRSYKEVGGVICEVNASPGLRPHWIANHKQDITTPIIEHIFPPNTPHTIPIAAITGTNGKTTTSKLVAHILRQSELTVGLTTSDGIYINDNHVSQHDASGAPEAQLVLQHPDVQAAVFETARGGIAKHGIGYNQCDVAAVLNITEDHFGLNNINTPEQMAHLKQLVALSAKKMVVLNADDALCLAMAKQCKAEQICLITQNPNHKIVNKHIKQGKPALICDSSDLNHPVYLYQNRRPTLLFNATEIPITHKGKAEHNIKNAMYATAISIGLEQPIEKIQQALNTFTPTTKHSPGRANIYTELPFTVIMDLASNPASMIAASKMAHNIHQGNGKKILVLYAPGNRLNDHYKSICQTIAHKFDHFICTCMDNLRGRGPTEVQQILSQHLQNENVNEKNITITESETQATEIALNLAEPGDLVTICCDNHQKVWNKIINFQSPRVF